MKAVRTHIFAGWVLLYLERWLVRAVRDGGWRPLAAERGTPQGRGQPIMMICSCIMHSIAGCNGPVHVPVCVMLMMVCHERTTRSLGSAMLHKDEGGPLEAACRTRASNHLKLLASRRWW
jgi:hypothetical protein